MNRFLTLTFLTLFAIGLVAPPGQAQPQNLPTISSRADSLALEVYQALGGPNAWQALKYLRFTFAVEDNGNRNTIAHHLWNRHTGDYRVEWDNQKGDTTFVVLFNVNTKKGSVYANKKQLSDSQSDPLLKQAYRRFINDTYWLLAPVKLLDKGARRTYVSDSSTAETAVLHLSFNNVGLTPGDQYWHYIDRNTHRPKRWAFHLQHYEEDQPASSFKWLNYKKFSTPEGPVWIATRKESLDGSRAILTDRVQTPTTVPSTMFSEPSPQL